MYIYKYIYIKNILIPKPTARSMLQWSNIYTDTKNKSQLYTSNETMSCMMAGQIRDYCVYEVSNGL